MAAELDFPPNQAVPVRVARLMAVFPDPVVF
jgi:hypothetical protein